MKYVDVGVNVLFIASLIVIYFFWGCYLEFYVTVLAVIIIAVTGLTTYLQYGRLREPEEEKKEDIITQDQ